jgi:hypothetical protein
VNNHIAFNGGPLDGHQRPFPDATLPFFTHRGDDEPSHVHQHVYRFDGVRMQFEYLGYVTPRYRPGDDVRRGDDDSVRD